MELKERLKLLRETFGISTRAMSAKLGLDATLWSQYESGRREPGALAIRALLKLDVNPHWLLEGHGSMFAGGKRRRKSKPNLPKLLELIEENVLALTEDWLEIWEIVLQALERSPSGLSEEELLALPGLPSLDKVMHELERLSGEELVAKTKGRYYLLRTRIKRDPRFADLEVLRALRDLVRHHHPSLSSGKKYARMDLGEIIVDGGLGVECAKQLWQLFENWRLKHSSSKGEGARIKILISTVIVENVESL